MTVNPDAPDYFECLRQWVRGERTPMVWLAVIGTCVMVVLVVTITQAIAFG